MTNRYPNEDYLAAFALNAAIDELQNFVLRQEETPLEVEPDFCLKVLRHALVLSAQAAWELTPDNFRPDVIHEQRRKMKEARP
jgi:hypothetical protein